MSGKRISAAPRKISSPVRNRLPESRLVLALDQGTTSSRAILFDHAGLLVASESCEFPQVFPRPGWVEQDPEAIWKSQIEVARAVLKKAAVGPAQIAAIGITNQRETVVVWDRDTGVPLGNAIVWQDRRSAEMCERLKRQGHESMVRRATGLTLDAYFSATKLAWILKHIPGAGKRARQGGLLCGTIDTWLLWRLTAGKVHATDPSNASRTMLFDLRRQEWDPTLLELFQLPRSMLPEVRPSAGQFGTTTALGSEISITAMIGDQQAALFGQMCDRPGMAKNTYGTGCFLLMPTGPRPIRSRNRLLGTVAWRIGDSTEYALEGGVFIGGAVVQWLRDGLGIISHADEIEPLAGSVPDSGGIQLVPAFVGLGAPHWDPQARGTILGITRGTTKAHLARAALEAIAWQVAEVLAAMERDSGTRVQELRVDGGGSCNDLLLSIQADYLGIPVVRSGIQETTALGAAYLAGLASSFWSDRKALASQWREAGRFIPKLPTARRNALRTEWSRAVERSRNWAR